MSLNLEDNCYIRIEPNKEIFTSKKYLVKLLKIRGVIKLKQGETIAVAIKRTGGIKLTKIEKLLINFIKV